MCDPSRPTTPPQDQCRTLRKTISFTSIDTVCPPRSKGIRRRIEEIAENLKQKSSKRFKRSSIQEVASNVTSDSKTVTEGKPAKHARKATPLRDSSHTSDRACVLAVADGLHSGVPLGLELDPPLAISGCKSDSPIGVPLFRNDRTREDCSLPIRALALGAHFAAGLRDALQSPPIVEADIKDLQLDLRPSEADITLWDGLHAAHHVFKCRLLLRCSTHPYDSVSLPEIRDVEMECSTCPPGGSHYTRPPVLQATYAGASPGPMDPAELPSVNPSAGIHMDRAWCKIQGDGEWGWYKDAYIPLSPRLFDKMDHREFKLISRVWAAESCIETELTFGISMLLREVDMK